MADPNDFFMPYSRSDFVLYFMSSNWRGENFFQWTMEALLLRMPTLCNLIVSLGVIIYIVITMAGSLVAVMALRLFGSLGTVETLFMDLAVQPVPHGGVVLEQFDWRDEDGVGALSLSHSRSYLHPGALERLGKWVEQSLRKSPSSSNDM